MQVNLHKPDLIRLIKGHGGGSYTLAEHLQVRKLGGLTGFPNERMQWNDKELKALTEQQLWDTYQEMVNWKEPPIQPNKKMSRKRVTELQENYFNMYGKWLEVPEDQIEEDNLDTPTSVWV